MWCFLSAGRLRQLAAELGDAVTLAGRLFLLAPDEGAALARWPDHASRKAALLAGWRRARARPGGETIDPELADRRLPKLPLSLPAAAAVKGAEELAGMAGHLILLRRLQELLFLEGRDVGDTGVILQGAASVGLDPAPLAVGLEAGAFLADARADDAGARALGITDVPTVVLDERWTLVGAAGLDRYRAGVRALLEGRPPEGWGDLDAPDRPSSLR